MGFEGFGVGGVCGLGCGAWGLRFGVWGLGFGVWGLGVGDWGLGVRGWGFGIWCSEEGSYLRLVDFCITQL